jgi:anti-sigma factor RsiW
VPVSDIATWRTNLVPETAFSFSSDGPVPGFYWVDQGYGYALAGKLPRHALMDLATAVYRQL